MPFVNGVRIENTQHHIQLYNYTVEEFLDLYFTLCIRQIQLSKAGFLE